MNLLVADIGGTNARFAYQADNTKELSNFAYLKNSWFCTILITINLSDNNVVFISASLVVIFGWL